MIKKPYIIGISGESGVGKSTLAEIISLFYGEENTLLLSTDDLHKWERSNSNWKNITHLNPAANNLELGDMHLRDLINNRYIWRSTYNHKVGWYNPPVKIFPKPIIVIEGLHAFYTTDSQSMIDLKIFVDADREIVTHWKLLRDTEQRGYKYNDVLETIEKRKFDNEKLREKQINCAELIVKIKSLSNVKNLGNKFEPIDLSFNIIKKQTIDIPGNLIEFLQNYLHDFHRFIKISENYGQNLDLCQNGGGNISVKSDDYLIIKASGYDVKNVNCLSGYSIITSQAKNMLLASKNVSDYEAAIFSVGSGHNVPSMEVGMHLLLKKYVVHLHSIYPTLILCLQESRKIIEKIYKDLDFAYIPYTTPGFDLFERLRKKKINKNCIFLENHGIVVTSDVLEECQYIVNTVNTTAEQYLRQHDDFLHFDIRFAQNKSSTQYPFPDSVIFYENPLKQEIIAAHNYINNIGCLFGKIRHLSDNQIDVIRNLNTEKYRQVL